MGYWEEETERGEIVGREMGCTNMVRGVGCILLAGRKAVLISPLRHR